MTAPRSEALVRATARFDAASDAGLERLRGHSAADHVFRTASELGDWSVIWLMVVAAWGLTSARRTDRALRMVALLAAESLVVNQGIKRLFVRTRPTEAGDPRYPVRRPYTSSFPSGHASAGFFAATLLTESEPALAPLWFGLAGVVATSRAHVRVHHPSDVVAGAVTGVALAAVARRLWPAR